MRIVSFILSVLLGSSVAINIQLMDENYRLYLEKQDRQVLIEYLTSKVGVLTEDGAEARALAVYWKRRAQVVAQERDNARHALETVWQPTIIYKGTLRDN